MKLTKDNFNSFVSEVSQLLNDNDSIDVIISVDSLENKLRLLKSEGKKIVLTYGTYDLLHIGHLNLLKRAKALGDVLIIGISSDNFNKIKNKESYLDYKRRKMILENIKFVDFVFPEENWDQKIDDIKKYNVDIFVMGDDWEGKFDELKEYCDVVYLPRTKNISTTDLKKEIQ